MQYFLDTNAMIEIERGNRAYRPYLSRAHATSVLHLYEMAYAVHRDRGEERARRAVSDFRPFCVGVEDEDMIAASAFRLSQRRRRYSYADALGYQMAVRRGMRFLTGDRAFKGLKRVEFVR